MTPLEPGAPYYVIGVDAGGNKTAAMLARLDASEGSPQLAELGRGLAGPGNPIATGWENACKSIVTAMEKAVAQVGLPRREVDAVCLAVAGAGSTAVRERLESWVRDIGMAARLHVVTDGVAVLAAGTSEGFGIALIAGTGSLALARTAEGTMLRCGGWGYRLGDEGGGYWLGLKALRSVVQMADGRRSPTSLKESLLAVWEADDARQVVEEIARGEAESPSSTRERIAGLAPTVLQAAEQQDPAAVELVDAAATELQRLVVALLNRAEVAGGDYELALAGSLLLRSEVLTDRLLTRLTRSEQSPRRVGRVSQPELGAARIAAGLVTVGSAKQVDVDHHSP